jgi:hypothetical protein
VVRQGYGNARFEVNSEEGLDLVEEFDARDIGQTDVEQSQRGLSTEVIAIKQGLRQSVKALR